MLIIDDQRRLVGELLIGCAAVAPAAGIPSWIQWRVGGVTGGKAALQAGSIAMRPVSNCPSHDPGLPAAMPPIAGRSQDSA
ncbi:MAG: hypothetical protein ACREPZ_12420 [Rhodanobacteraceae bacterium]